MKNMFVVKVGGREGNSFERTARDIARYGDFVLVHGGSTQLDSLMHQLGKEIRYIKSPSGHVSRHTDAEVMELLAMTLSGKLNVELVTLLQSLGVNAVGLSGVDGRLLEGRRKSALRHVEDGKVKIVHDDRSGVVEDVNVALLNLLLKSGYVPVVTLPIIDGSGLTLNVDADRVAASIAVALKADDLLLLTNVPGVMHHPDDPRTLISHITSDEIDAMLERASGGMKRKLIAAREALKGNVSRVVIGDSRRDHPVTDALAGLGTVIS